MSKIGIIGGSALYDIDEIKILKRKKVDTPFGSPSDEFVIGEYDGREVIFLPRHGKKHTILPSEINYRANIYAFKVLGVERIISVSAVGSMKKEIPPLDIVLVDQFIDRTNQARPTTFFGDGIVAHVPFSHPVCEDLREAVYKANIKVGAKIHPRGTYINMEGPAFSTRAESDLYRSWGADVIGMTNMPEARLCREAGICYSTIAAVTDYDCWYEAPGVETVSVEMVIANLKKNVEVAKKILKNVFKNLPEKRSCNCGETLKHAIVTPKDAVPKETLKKLEPILKGFF